MASKTGSFGSVDAILYVLRGGCPQKFFKERLWNKGDLEAGRRTRDRNKDCGKYIVKRKEKGKPPRESGGGAIMIQSIVQQAQSGS